jgi:hypothetical protein
VVPLAGDTDIQVGSLTDTVHDPPVHPTELALTVNTVDPPPAGIVGTEVGIAENEHVGCAVTVRLTVFEVTAPRVALMFVVPVAMLVAKPLAAMVATPGVAEAQVT